MIVHIKLWTTDHKDFEMFNFPCPQEKRDELVGMFVREVALRFQGVDLRVIRLGQNRYNIVPTPIANA